MGAASPSHPDGDRAMSTTGIVQGHAYSVLSIKEIDQNKLIKLRNPHGSGTEEEWAGAWSDMDSVRWTKRLQNLADYDVESKKEKDKFDGVFWMCVDDMATEFSRIDVCRVFDSNIWKEFEVIKVFLIVYKGNNSGGVDSK